MKKILTRFDLDKLTCQAPGCTHDHHDGLVMRGACHVRSPSIARYRGGAIEISCSTCDRAIAVVALHSQERAAADAMLACDDPHCQEPPENHSLVFRPPCHRDAGVFVTYRRGQVTIACGNCAASIGDYRVAAAEKLIS